MQIMMKMLADTAEKMEGHKKEAEASKEERKEARAKRLKAGKESEQAQAKLNAQTSGGKSTRRLILPDQEQNKQEESSTGGGPSGVLSPTAHFLSGVELTTDEEVGADMQEARNKREREDNEEEQGRAKRSVTPVQGQLAAAEKTSTEEHATGSEGDTEMQQEL
jgi:hypothetical protein